jgi:hypothetical protein
MMRANRHRGEVRLQLGHEIFVLRLSLGALAELESAFGAGDLAALGARLGAGSLSTTDVITLLGVSIRGGGGTFSDADIASRIDAADVPQVLVALSELLRLTFLPDDSPPNPLPPQET